MRNKKLINRVFTFVIMLSFGFLLYGCFKDEYEKKTYSSYSQYYETRAIDIANGAVTPGTPVVFMARVNFNGYTRELTALTDISGALYGNKVSYSGFRNAFAECNGTIYGVIKKNRTLKVLRVEKDGNVWKL